MLHVCWMCSQQLLSWAGLQHWLRQTAQRHLSAQGCTPEGVANMALTQQELARRCMHLLGSVITKPEQPSPAERCTTRGGAAAHPM